MMNQGLIFLADNLRVSYGAGLLALLRMVLRASAAIPLTAAGTAVTLDAGAQVSLAWPRWYAPTAGEMQQDAGMLTTLTGAGLLSRETALASVADVFGVDDVGAELARIGPALAQAR